MWRTIIGRYEDILTRTTRRRAEAKVLRRDYDRLSRDLQEARDENNRLRLQIDDDLSQIHGLQARSASYDDLQAHSVSLDKNGVELLGDADFQEAHRSASGLTLLDLPRLANICQLLRLSNPRGNVAELGVFRGGCSVFMARVAPERHFFLCDTFAGFGTLPIDPVLDRAFSQTQFDNTTADLVSATMSRVTQNFELVQGYFPDSDRDGRVRDISFAHIDLDLHESTLLCLRYLADRVAPRSIFVLDDFHRGAPGVMKAVSEFLAADDRFVAFPMFPSQGVMFHKSWFERSAS